MTIKPCCCLAAGDAGGRAVQDSSPRAPYHKSALQDMEEYFGLKGLLADAALLTYQRHNTRVHQAVQAATAAVKAATDAEEVAVQAAKAAANKAAGEKLEHNS